MPSQSASDNRPIDEVFLSSFPNATAQNLSLFIITNQRTNKFSPDDITPLSRLIQAVNFGVSVYKASEKKPLPGQKLLVKTTKGYVFTADFDMKEGKPHWEVHANVSKAKMGEVEFWTIIAQGFFPMASSETTYDVDPMVHRSGAAPLSSGRNLFTKISTEAALRKIIESESFKKAQVLLKKSNCNIGVSVFETMIEKWTEDLPHVYFIDMTKDKPLALKASEILKNEHQSPQMMIVWQGKVYWDASHYGINNMRTIRIKIEEIRKSK